MNSIENSCHFFQLKCNAFLLFSMAQANCFTFFTLINPQNSLMNRHSYYLHFTDGERETYFTCPWRSAFRPSHGPFWKEGNDGEKLKEGSLMLLTLLSLQSHAPFLACSCLLFPAPRGSLQGKIYKQGKAL